jgi:hypothetical protein
MMEFRPSLPRKLAGFSLIGLGALGAILPILPGFVFFALGLFVMRHQYMWAHRGMAWTSTRWPDTTSKLEEMETRMLMRLRESTAKLKRAIGLG